MNAKYYNESTGLTGKGGKSCSCSSLIPYIGDTGYESDSLRIHQQNLWFHIFSFVGALFELPKFAYYFYSDYTPSYSGWLYPFHLLSIFCIYISFCLIINLWGSAIVFEANDSKRAKFLRYTLVFLVLINGLFALLTIIYDLIISHRDMDAVGDSWEYKGFIFDETIGLAVLSSFFLIFGCKAKSKISNTFNRSGSDWANDRNFRNGLIRLTVIIAICFVCFTMKAVFSMMLYFKRTNSLCSTPIDSMGVVLWTLLYEWIPDIIPRLSLLYLMSRNMSHDDGQVVSGDGHRASGDYLSDDHPFLGKSFAHNSRASADGFTGQSFVGGGFAKINWAEDINGGFGGFGTVDGSGVLDDGASLKKTLLPPQSGKNGAPVRTS